MVEFAEDTVPASAPKPVADIPAPPTPTKPAVLAAGISASAVEGDAGELAITTPNIRVAANGIAFDFDTNTKANVVVESTHTYGVEGGTPWLLRPGQRAVVENQQSVKWSAVPLVPEIEPDPVNTSLVPIALDTPHVSELLEAVLSYEEETFGPIEASLQNVEGKWAPTETISEEHLALYRNAVWSTAPDGTAVGRVPLDVFRVAVWAVTADFTVLEVADWIRSTETIEIKEAVSKAQGLIARAVPILTKAGFDHRVVSAQFAQFSFNRGVLAFQRGDLKGAVHHFNRAISLERTLLSAHYNLGVTYYRAARYQDAADAFLVASGIDGAPVDVFFNRGAALYRVGDLMGAARAFRKVLEQIPTDEAAKSWLQKADPEGKTAPPKKKKRKKRRRRRRRK